jgi:hypothetical protein
MKIILRWLNLLLVVCIAAIRSVAAPGPIISLSTETNSGGGAIVETFTIVNLEPNNSGLDILKVKFDFPVRPVVLSIPSGWSWVSYRNSIEAFARFSGPPVFDTSVHSGQSLSGLRFFVNQSIGSIPVTYTIRTPQSNLLKITGTSMVSQTFSAFTGNLEVSRGGKPGFELKMTFSLSANTDGISPVSEPVLLQVGFLSALIPPASFHLSQYGNYVFEGIINGVNLEAQIKPLGGNSFLFKAEGGSTDLTALTNPVTVALTIGNDTGLTTVSAEH